MELRISDRGSTGALAESMAARLAGINPPGSIDAIRKLLGLRPIYNVREEGLETNGRAKTSEREQQRLKVLKATISGLVDRIQHYKITKPVYVTQLRSQWPGLNIQTLDNQDALKAGIIPRRSTGANYHPQVTPEEIVLLNMIYRQSDQRPNDGQITELKNLIREEFTKRGLI